MNMLGSSSAPGKIILCGEYAVVFGYPGIAIPSSLRIEATFRETAKKEIHVEWADEHHAAWDAYVQKIIDLCRKKSELPGGTLTLANHLPLGRGMGSSTAFVIAISRCLLGPDCRADAEEIENEMSPGNSGIDFAVIWDETPLLFSRDEGAEPVELSSKLLEGALLIDSGVPNEATSELVAWIKEQKEQSEDIEKALQKIGHCAERVLAGEDLRKIFPEHHRAQITLGVVPQGAQELISLIENKGGVAKVIGAGAKKGGGGMVLAVGIGADLLPKEYSVTSL